MSPRGAPDITTPLPATAPQAVKGPAAVFGGVWQPFYEADMPETDYLQMSAAIALAAIFLLPDIQDKRPEMRFTSNTMYIIVVLTSIMFASIPPTMVIHLPLIGCIGMLGSFVFPARTV